MTTLLPVEMAAPSPNQSATRVTRFKQREPLRIPVPMSAAAAELAVLLFEAKFERDFENVLDVSVDLPQDRITFFDDGMLVCAPFTLHQFPVATLEKDALPLPTVLEFGAETKACSCFGPLSNISAFSKWKIDPRSDGDLYRTEPILSS